MPAAVVPLAALAARREACVGLLGQFVSIPSVSSDPRRGADVRRAAEWLRRRLISVGMRRARLVETGGHPVVCAQWTRPRAPATVLFYGHYDVVAPGPRDQWRSPPFSPAKRGRFLYGRGSSDDKGPLLSQIAALEAWLLATGSLPVNAFCVFEGEEEIGSPGLRRILERLPPARRKPPIDAVLISDTRMLAPDRPALITGLRGSLAAEIDVTGPPRELHSGAFGGAVRNPAHVLADLLASLHDTDGRVSIESFYSGVRVIERPRLDSSDRRLLAAQIESEAGRGCLFGEPGFTAHERSTIRPSLDVNGVRAGHTGAGGKGVIPATATAKLSFRLVPDQDPRHIATLLKRHVTRHVPHGARVKTTVSKLSHPVSIDPRSPALIAAHSALTAGFGHPPVLLPSGGSIPVVELFATRLGVPVLMGFARADDGMHGPNERVDLDALAAGARSIVHYLDRIGRSACAPGTHREQLAA